MLSNIESNRNIKIRQKKIPVTNVTNFILKRRKVGSTHIQLYVR